MRAVSLFSGVDGFGLGLEQAGIQTVLQCEIDPVARSVLERHWPATERIADVRDVRYPSALPMAELLYGGFPCQDLSVAGQRQGLAGDRSGLFFEFARIVKEMREASHGRFPKYVLLENVPGLLSASSGRDFGALLNGLVDCGAVDIAWRVIDAQHWVPQRRRRVFILAIFPPASDGRAGIGRAGEILALAEGGSRYPAPGRAPGEDVAATSGGGAAIAGSDVAGTLGGGSGNRGWPSFRGNSNDTYVPTVAGPLTTGASRGGGFRQDLDGTTYVPTDVVNSLTTDPHSDRQGEENKLVVALVGVSNRGNDTGDQAETLRSASHGAIPMVAQSDALRGRDGGSAIELGGDKATALRASQGGGDKAYALTAIEDFRGKMSGGPEVGLGITEDGPMYSLQAGHEHAVAATAGVRRLTPTECEALMGWPRDHTKWTADGTEIPDSHRYRLIGNGVVAPVAFWIGQRLIAAFEEGA